MPWPRLAATCRRRWCPSAVSAALLLCSAPAATAQVSFSAPTDRRGSEPTAVAIGHLDRGGAGDLVAANRADDDVSFFASDGFGGFGLPGSFMVGDAPRAIAIGDYDGDANSTSPSWTATQATSPCCPATAPAASPWRPCP